MKKRGYVTRSPILKCTVLGQIQKTNAGNKANRSKKRSKFFVIRTLDPNWIRIGIQPKMLDPDPYQMNRVHIRNNEKVTRIIALMLMSQFLWSPS
jgi:hypothetical protein